MSTTAFTSNMFESIKSALTKETAPSTNKYKDILKTEAGNTYNVRLLPNIKDPAKTFFHYYSYTWKSFANGQLINITSPATWGKRDLIAEERYRILRTGTEEEKAKAAALTRRESWFVNVYVVNDPVNDENNGQVKVLRFGRQLHKIIMDAMQGEEAVDFGPRIFDLSAKGCNFRIKVEKQGDYPTYVSSKFALPKEIPGIEEDDMKEIYNKTFDLESFVTIKENNEIKQLLDEHYYGIEASEEIMQESKDLEVSQPVKNVSAPAQPTPPTLQQSPSTFADDTIEDLLKGLE
jgi:hypothetical protein